MVLSTYLIRIILALVLQICFSDPSNASFTHENSEDYNTWKTFAIGNSITIFKFFNGWHNFHAAMDDCRGRGAELASFHSLEELQFIFEEANTVMNSSENFWIGLYHNGERVNGLPNLKMYFTDGTDYDLPTTAELHKKIWVPLDDSYQPDAHHWSGSEETEYCVEATNGFGSPKYFLNDVTCSTIMNYYVCMRKYIWEKPKWMTSSGEVITASPSLGTAPDSTSEDHVADPKQEVNPDNGMAVSPQSNGLHSTDATQELQKIHRVEVTCLNGGFYSTSLYAPIAEIGFPVALICIILGLLGLQRSSLRNRLLAYTNDSYEFNGNGNNVCLSNV